MNGRVRPLVKRILQEAYQFMNARSTAVSDRSMLSRSARNEEILSVATRVFAERGYRNTDVQEIADKVGVGKATIYRSFGTKEELFFAAVDHGMQRLNQLVANDEEEDNVGSAERMENCLLRFFGFFAENEDLIELLMQERSEFRDRDSHSFTRNWLVNSPRWQRRIAKAIEQDIYRCDVSADALIKLMSSLCYGAIFTHYFAKEDMDLESTARMITDVVRNGILSDTERQRRKHDSENN